MSKYAKEVNMYLLSIREGDESAMKKLYDLTANHLKGFIWGYLRNKSYLDDVLMQTYERALSYIATFDAKKDGYNWLCEIAKNLAYSYYSKDVPTVDIDSLQGEAFSNNWSDDLEAKIDLSLAMEKLNETDQRIFYLRVYVQATLSEIGKEFGISKVAVHLRLKKIYKIIGKNYKNS